MRHLSLTLSFVLLLLVILSVHSQEVILLASNTTNTIITDASGRTLQVVTSSGVTFDGAVWISDDFLNTYPNGNRMTFESSFTTDCPSETVTLSIIGDDNFEAYLNGQFIGSDSGWSTIRTYPISLQCGTNNLTTVSINGGGKQGIIFSLKQNQTNCYNCSYSYLTNQTVSEFVDSSVHYYNSSICQCDCSNTYACTAPLEWMTFPNCGCACPLVLSCPSGYVLNASSCSCNSTDNSTMTQSESASSSLNQGDYVLLIILAAMILFSLCLIIGMCCFRSKKVHQQSLVVSEQSQSHSQLNENRYQGKIDDVMADIDIEGPIFQILDPSTMNSIQIGPSLRV